QELLLSPPVVSARRPSARWSEPLSPDSLGAELSAATRQSKAEKVARVRRQCQGGCHSTSARAALAQMRPPVWQDRDRQQPNDPSAIPLAAVCDPAEP